MNDNKTIVQKLRKHQKINKLNTLEGDTDKHGYISFVYDFIHPFEIYVF